VGREREGIKGEARGESRAPNISPARRPCP